MAVPQQRLDRDTDTILQYLGNETQTDMQTEMQTEMLPDRLAFLYVRWPLRLCVLSQQLQGKTQDHDRAKAGPRKNNVAEEMKTNTQHRETHMENSVNVKRRRIRQGWRFDTQLGRLVDSSTVRQMATKTLFVDSPFLFLLSFHRQNPRSLSRSSGYPCLAHISFAATLSLSKEVHGQRHVSPKETPSLEIGEMGHRGNWK